MPIYEYKCRDNGHVFEAWQKISDDPVESCEVCGSPVDKLVSQSAFHLKGSGWYATDYKKSEKPKAESSTSGEPAKAEAKTESSAAEKKGSGKE